MFARHHQIRRLLLLVGVLCALAGGGCRQLMREIPESPPVGPIFEGEGVPRELSKVTLPPYVIEPPDILLVDAIRVIPKIPFLIQPLDILQIQVANTLLDHPIAGQYIVEPGGAVDLGPAYGKARVAGLSLDEAAAVVERHLTRVLREPQVSLTLLQSSGQQQISGEHLVGPDGTVNLGLYGSVRVTNMTLNEAKAAIEKHLSQYLEAPLVAVDVFSYNSKVYYVITQGAGFGDNVARFPSTGNETVLDAVAQINGLSRVSSKNIWIARPAPGGVGCDQVLPIHWQDITRGGSTATNYQLLPGDRLYIAEDRMIAFDSLIDKLISPFERMVGFTLLSAQMVQTINRFPLGFSTF